MSDAFVVEILVKMIMVTAKVSAPILIASLAIGLGVSLLQAVTQIQEVTLTFVPKLFGVAIVVVLSGNWMLAQLLGFTRELFEMIPRLIAA